MERANDLLIKAEYPLAQGIDDALEEDFAFLQEIVRAIRTLRSECTIPPEKKLSAALYIESAESLHFIEENSALIKMLASLSGLKIERGAAANEERQAAKGFIASAGAGFEVFIFIAEAVDINILIAKWNKEAEKDKKFIALVKAKLANDSFINRAPKELIEAEKEKLYLSELRLKKTNAFLACFS